MAGYIVKKEKWLENEVSQIRSLTYLIDATSYGARIPQNLKDIESIARRARKRFIDLGLDKEEKETDQ